MNIRLYLNDWFYNAGIIGFLKILEHNEDNFAKVQDNYIEFDTNNLRNFHKYYFKYFFDKYNVAENLKKDVEPHFNYIEENIEKENITKEDLKKIKSNKKEIKGKVKKQLDKIKELDENIYLELKDIYDNIENFNNKEDIQDEKNKIFKIIEIDNINKKLTSNIFKQILGNNFFGQQSIFNIAKSSSTYEEQEDIVYRDYISNIVEIGYINDVLEQNVELEELSKYINNALEKNKISDDIKKVYKNINKKYIEKGKPIEDIKKYINEQVIGECTLCENHNLLTSNYTEGMFIPLAMSSENAKNFFWNQDINLKVCDMCKLMLLCSPVGISNITKIEKDVKEMKESNILSFVNIDTDVKTLLKTNNILQETSKRGKKYENPYVYLIQDIVEQNKQISSWQLDNIFIVEIDSEYRKKSRLYYFNIKRNVARFLVQYSNKTLNLISDRKYKIQIVDDLLKNKDLKYTIYEKMHNSIKENKDDTFNNLLAVQSRYIINLLKKEGENMDIEKNNKKIYAIYKNGNEIHDILKARREESKLDSYVYRMLNSIKNGNKQDFMDLVVRIYLMMEKDVPAIFIELLQEDTLDLETIGYSFLIGLISNKYEKKEEMK